MYSLPSSVVEAKSVNSFERRLDRLWRNQPVYYNYREAIQPTGYDMKTDSSDEEIELVQQVVADLLPEEDLSFIIYHIGYACRADKNPYRHDCRADKNPNRHDRRADSQCPWKYSPCGVSGRFRYSDGIADYFQHKFITKCKHFLPFTLHSSGR